MILKGRAILWLRFYQGLPPPRVLHNRIIYLTKVLLLEHPKLGLKKPDARRLLAMTIGIGFVCSDGIVICSDKQMTGEGGYKYEDSKITTSQGDDVSFIYTYAGDPDAAQMMFEKSKQALQIEMPGCEFDSMDSVAQQTLEKVFRDKQAKGLSTLFGITAHGQHFLIKTKETKVVKGKAEYIGFGDSSVLRYVCDFLLPSRLDVDQAQVLASYLVSVAGRYMQYCGERVDHAILHVNGNVGTGTGGPWPNQRERYLYCEEEIEKGLRELLFSGGTKAIAIVKPSREDAT
jgi:hypothetical protein